MIVTLVTLLLLLLLCDWSVTDSSFFFYFCSTSDNCVLCAFSQPSIHLSWTSRSTHHAWNKTRKRLTFSVFILFFSLVFYTQEKISPIKHANFQQENLFVWFQRADFRVATNWLLRLSEDKYSSVMCWIKNEKNDDDDDDWENEKIKLHIVSFEQPLAMSECHMSPSEYRVTCCPIQHDIPSEVSHGCPRRFVFANSKVILLGRCCIMSGCLRHLFGSSQQWDHRSTSTLRSLSIGTEQTRDQLASWYIWIG